MPELHLIVLALIQGIAEVIPVSVSAHRIFLPLVTGWDPSSQLTSLLVHIGILLAVLAYFSRDVTTIIIAIYKIIKRKKYDGKKLLGYIVLGSVPMVIGGYIHHHYFPHALESITIVAWMSLIFGILLYLSDRAGLTIRRIEHLDKPAAFIIGLTQLLGFVPGISRLGVSITAARILGFERRDAARFSFLLAIPVMITMIIIRASSLSDTDELHIDDQGFMIIGLAFITGLFALTLMMNWLKKRSYTPFVVYRIALAIMLLIWIYQPFGWTLF